MSKSFYFYVTFFSFWEGLVSWYTNIYVFSNEIQIYFFMSWILWELNIRSKQSKSILKYIVSILVSCIFSNNKKYLPLWNQSFSNILHLSKYFRCSGQHDGAVVSSVVSQQEGPEFGSTIWQGLSVFAPPSRRVLGLPPTVQMHSVGLG